MERRKGFTIFELLIVVAIIGILAALMLPSLFNSGPKARDARRVADLTKIRDVLSAASLVGQSYPDEAMCISSDTFSAYLRDFNGEIPVDPIQDKEWELFVSGDDIGAADDVLCQNEYMYYPTPGNAYSFVLYSKMETLKHTNIHCVSLFEFIFMATEDIADTPDDWCYGLITK